MIAEILPEKVQSAEAFDDLADVSLFPEEEAVIRKAVTKRRQEFSTVRYCARQALARLGCAAVPLVPGERGAPLWPSGVVGSMTHCAGYRAAAAAHHTDIAAIGIDAEPHAPLPDGVLDAIARSEEQESLRHLTSSVPGTYWDRLLFSAKESTYKAWYPLTRTWLDFEGASITIDPRTNTFHTRIVVNAGADAPRHFHGRWLVDDDLLITAIAQTPERD